MAKKEIRTVQIPEGIDITLETENVKVKGPKGELMKELSYPGISITKDGNIISITAKSTIKKQKAITGTYQSHIKNMIKGVTEGYTANMKAVFSHFPVTIKQEGNIIEIHNFLGEKVPRKAKIVGNAQVKIEKDAVTVDGINKEDVGQTVANIELATKVRGKDIRIFQDGIYVTQKP